MVAVPDHLAELFLCDAESSQHPYTESADPLQKIYGHYYAVLFSLRTPGEHAGALTLLWARENEQWKIIAYEILAP